MELYVVVASAGRSSLCSELASWSRCMIVPENSTVTWIVSTPSVGEGPAELPSNWRHVTGAKGAAAQRNVALDRVPDAADIVVFFDDDTLPRPDYFCRVADHFSSHSSHIALTGRLIRDGAAEKREVERGEALRELERSRELDSPKGWRASSEMYGCNAAVRWASVKMLRFDERLPLYSWLEDLDYARQAMRIGEVVQIDTAVAVHLGASSGGRTQHRRIGYSQIANPAWLNEKGALGFAEALRLSMGPFVRNLAGSLRWGAKAKPRRERLSGNLLAIWDQIKRCGRSTPERILDL